MAHCLYEPAECESERTVIISELQGGENDPDQLLEQELTALAFRAHSYRHPTIGWLSDLQTMTRDDLYGHYRRFYVPNNATLVIVGDVDTDTTLRLVDRHFGSIPARPRPLRRVIVEPEQRAERRVILRRAGTAAYWRAGFHAPPFSDAAFLPLLCADAALTGAAGLNIWSGYKVPPPQRSARLYRALVDAGLASSVSGSLLPTELPFLYYLAATVAEGQTLAAVEEVVLGELDRLTRDGVTEAELAKARAQLRARFVYDGDSVTDIAHQLGYFATIASWRAYQELERRLALVTVDQVNDVARRTLTARNRTIGWFEPESPRAS
jgi:zinc protease